LIKRQGNPQNDQAQKAWEANAAFWDERMGEGNDFVNILEWPAIERLLAVQPGERVLDAACGNGLTSRRLAALGTQVTAFDFSANMIAYAKERSSASDNIQFHVIDGTNETALIALGEGLFDAALCNMALFDMAEIDPLLRALSRLLKPKGRFVFSVVHPAFNNSTMAHVAELVDKDGELVTTYSVKIWGYLTSTVLLGAAIAGQPEPQPYFHRPLTELFGACFRAGFVLDGLEEPAFPPDHEQKPGKNPLMWSGKFSEIPPVLVARVRTTG
jgi:2-polyprenyl-3-methyl-5-hydroxy-6-metoxy-1,4-benzoquinol methylase